MAVSGRKSKMSKGRLDNAVVKFTNTEWVEDTTKNGKDIVQLATVFIDADGQEHPYNFILGDQKYVRVEDGKLASVDDSRDYQISDKSPAGKMLVSLDDAGFSPKKLDNIGDTPEALDGQWVKVKQMASTSLKTDGTPFTDLIVEELIDEKDATGIGSSAKTKSSNKSEDKKSGKGKAAGRSSLAGIPAEVESDDDDDDAETAADEDDDDESDDEAEADPIAEAALDTVKQILADPAEYVRNFDEEAADGGISIKQAYTAAFAAFKGDKKAKGPVCNLINDPSFHKANAKNGEYQFDSKLGILTANPSKPATKKRK